MLRLKSELLMSRNAQDVTEAELGLLQVLWERGRCSTRQMTEVLYPGGKVAQYATVQKLLERLEDKGLVKRDRSLFVHTFVTPRPIATHELIGPPLANPGRQSSATALLAPIISHLARNQELSDKERRAYFRELIDARFRRIRKTARARG